MNCLIIVASIAWCTCHTSAFFHNSSMRLDAFKPNGNSGVNNSALFGFSLAYYAKKRSLLISAPTADLIGKLFECNISETSSCEEWSMVEDENTKSIRTGAYRDTKDNVTALFINSWFGATLCAGSSYFVACAPRFLEEYPHRKVLAYGIFGHCYISDDESYKTMIQLQERKFNDTMYQAKKIKVKSLTTFGWSSAIGQDPTGLIIGGPATHKAGAIVYESREQGLITNESKEKRNYPKPIYNAYHFDNAMPNLGYSVAIGNFFSNNEFVYAVGSPYGEKGVGKVVFFKKSEDAVFNNIGNNKYFKPIQYDLTDPERNVGSMFAAVLCTANLDGNGRVDIIVGAPAFSGTAPSMYEVGAVHVFYGIDLSSLGVKTITIKGEHARGRFGMAISSMGDLDDDSFDDIVIAAPYESDGQGAIYLYSGSALQSTTPLPKQKIIPEENGAPAFRNFGFSLAPLLGYDSIDSNGLAVGGLETSSVAFMHVIPSFQVDVEINDDHLQAQQDDNMLNFTIKTCLKLKFPSKPKLITASIQMKVKVIHAHATLAEYTNEVERYFLKKYDVQKPDLGPCENITVNTPTIGNYVTDPIKFIISVEQVDDPRLNRSANSSQGLLLERPTNVYTKDEYVKNNCADSQHCKPDLALVIQSKMSEPYLVGSSSSEAIRVMVTNNNETAYKWCFKMSSTGATLTHTGGCEDDRGWLTCRPANVLRKGDSWVFDEVRLKTDSLTSDDKKVTIKAIAYCNCSNNADMVSPTYTFSRTLQYDFENINLQGVNEGGLDIIKINETELDDKNGRLFRHIYTIINNGKTIWKSLPFEVELEKNDYLTYSDIKIYKSTDPSSCMTSYNDKSESSHFNVTCDLGVLGPGKKADIYLPIRVTTGNNGISAKNLTIESILTLGIGKGEKYKRVSTRLQLVKTELDPWVIPVACLFGLLILVLIALALYKFGFLKRKKKQELLVRKETIRRSLRLSSHGSGNPRSSVISKRNSMYQDANRDWSWEGPGLPSSQINADAPTKHPTYIRNSSGDFASEHTQASNSKQEVVAEVHTRHLEDK